MYMKTIGSKTIPFVTRTEMVEVDRLMIEKYGIRLIQMMENAGRNLSDLAQYLLQGELTGKTIAVLCGGGNNGGGGLAAARHMVNRGAEVHVALAVSRSKVKEIPAQQLIPLEQMGAEIIGKFPDGKYDMIIDALIGYGLRGKPQGLFAEWIIQMNQMQTTILSLDIPSGMDADTGSSEGVYAQATATMTLALPKKGMFAEGARHKVGDLFLADISVPTALLASIGKYPNGLFDSGAVVQIEY